MAKVQLPPKIEEKLAVFMATEGISSHDKSAVIARAIEIYLQHDAANDTGLSGIIEERKHARSCRGKEIWQKAKPGEKA